jgi:G:T-mismatch repair DNA endonuclease (very short patch repair protein)
MLSGMPLTRKAENGFKAERINRRDKLALEWLE